MRIQINDWYLLESPKDLEELNQQLEYKAKALGYTITRLDDTPPSYPIFVFPNGHQDVRDHVLYRYEYLTPKHIELMHLSLNQHGSTP